MITLFDGRVLESHGPTVGPSYQRTYTVKINYRDGPVELRNVRLKNARWSESWDTIALPAGSLVIAWKTAGRWIVVGFGPCETLPDCGGEGAAPMLLPPDPDSTDGDGTTVTPPGGGGGSGTIGPSTGPNPGGGGFE